MLNFHSRMIALVNFIQLTCQTLLIFFLILRWGLRWKANHRRANFWEKEMLKQKKLFLLSATANANSYCLCLLHRVCLLPSFVHPCLKKWFNTKSSDVYSLYLEVKGLLLLALWKLFESFKMSSHMSHSIYPNDRHRMLISYCHRK